MAKQAADKAKVAESFMTAPVVGVVRTDDAEEARRVARAFIAGGGGLELIEITFTVPGATDLVRELRRERDASLPGGPPWIGMGTVTTATRASQALDAGAEFVISPNVSRPVAEAARDADVFFALGALTCTEIFDAHALGADLVKVYPLPAVGGPDYLKVVRGPLGDIPMLAAGGFGIDDIPGYKEAGAIAFGLGGPLLGADDDATRANVQRALKLARPATVGAEP